jgi:hypothetical protein
MAKNENTSLIGKLFKGWMSYKAGKGALKLISGPAVVGGLGFYLFRRLRANRTAAI